MPAGQIIKTRRGTAAAWTSANPTLAAGEPGYETDTGKIKIGDGSTAWNSLAYRFTGAVTFGTPAITLGTSAAAGSIDEPIRRDATIAAFDTTVPSTQAFGDAAAIGTAAFAARRDHKHAMPATPVTTINKTGSTALTGAVTLTGGTNVTLTQSGQDISIAASGGAAAGIDGWVSSAVSLTYSSVDGATGVVTTGSSLVGTVPVGARVKFDQTTTKYFIVTAVDATTLTFWGGTDYTLANAAISNFSYSTAKVPVGFNPDPAKWTVETTNTGNNSQSSPTSGTWYNPGSISISVPIGCWFLSYEAAIGANRSSGGNATVKATLSTANNSESDTSLSMIVLVIITVSVGATISQIFPIISVHKGRTLTVASKTSYFLNVSPTASGMGSVDIRGDVAPAVIRAICAYL